MKTSLVLAFILLLGGCGGRAKQPPMTQLQIRQMQTHDFDTQDYKMVMKAMLNVLQDEGFIVKNVDVKLGFLMGEKEVNVQQGFFLFWGPSKEDRYTCIRVIQVSANVSEFGNQTRVRVNFQIKDMDSYGAVVSSNPITDPEYYQKFFSKVSKSIFIQEEQV